MYSQETTAAVNASGGIECAVDSVLCFTCNVVSRCLGTRRGNQSQSQQSRAPGVEHSQQHRQQPATHEAYKEKIVSVFLESPPFRSLGTRGRKQ